MLSVGPRSTNSAWEQPGDELPSIDPANGELVNSQIQHRLKFHAQGVSVQLGGGVEIRNLSVMPLVRLTRHTSASTTASMHLIAPERATFDPTLIPGADLVDGGRSFILETFDESRHNPLRIDAGLAVGYRSELSVLGSSVTSMLQLYGLTGVNSIHTHFNTVPLIDIGIKLYIGVGF
jgi:hypothetical protein